MGEPANILHSNKAVGYTAAVFVFAFGLAAWATRLVLEIVGAPVTAVLSRFNIDIGAIFDTIKEMSFSLAIPLFKAT